MIKKPLGKSGISVAPIAFGGNVFGWTAGQGLSMRLLDSFIGAGFNLIDTADVYSRWVPGNKGGESESIIGQWLKRSGKRQDVVIATKVGMELGPDKKGLSKAWIIQAAENSLRRLQTDYIDLYQAHIDDVMTPLEETFEGFSDLIKQGKVRALGASNYTAERLKQSLELSVRKGFPRYECLQPLYNLYDRFEFEPDLEDVCHQHSLGVIPYYSLAAGFLSGKYRRPQDLEGRARADRVRRYMNPRGERILAALDEVSSHINATPAQVALSWLASRKTMTAPIVSATSFEQLDELIEAVHLSLSPAHITQLDQASAREMTGSQT
jgi:aryl-alcohol dehydrogenase-like predicted oxidoreductase